MRKDTTELLAERASTHGDFAEVSRISQAIKDVFRTGRNWDHLPPDLREGLEMQASKYARFLSGDWTHPDHLDDIAGYARLMARHGK